MASKETIHGVPIKEEQIAAWVAEAESGFDVSAMKKRGRGRPGRSTAPSEVIALRLTEAELQGVDSAAAQGHTTRSAIIRAALAAYFS